jgi:hypothetical protein
LAVIGSQVGLREVISFEKQGLNDLDARDADEILGHDEAGAFR